MKLSLYYPCQPMFVTQKFGGNAEYYKSNGLNVNGHTGIDFYAPDGTAVRATHDGEVTFTGLDGSGGLTVVIRTNEEFDYGSGIAFYKTIYCHLQKDSFRVKPGDKVKVGDIIALADNTGLSTGSHLHFGLKPIYPGEADWQWYNLEPNNGFLGAVDPWPYFNGKYAADDARFLFLRDLSVGSWGTDVYELQRRLVEEYYAEFVPSGFFGWKTKQAVIDYQLEHGIDPLGRVGPKTRASLNS